MLALCEYRAISPEMQVLFLLVREIRVLKSTELTFGPIFFIRLLVHAPRLLLLQAAPLVMLRSTGHPARLYSVPLSIGCSIDIREGFLKEVKLGLPQTRVLEHLLHFGGTYDLVNLEKARISMVPDLGCLMLVALEGIVEAGLKVYP